MKKKVNNNQSARRIIALMLVNIVPNWKSKDESLLASFDMSPRDNIHKNQRKDPFIT